MGDIEKEMTSENARFIILRDAISKAPVGFVHYQFLVEDKRAVLYWYN